MIIVANWKAKVEDIKEAKKLALASKKIAEEKVHTIIIAPPTPFLSALTEKKSKLQFSGQDVSATSGGAQTGEVTAPMLKASGASYVLIGHSERRALGDTNEVVAQKVQKALANGLIPILCIGERERDPDASYLQFIKAQLQSVYESIDKKNAQKILLAYEPIWAIGNTADNAIAPDDLVEMVHYIHKILSQFVTKKIADATPILYGGAVDETNVRTLTENTGVAGALVGRASSDAASFRSLVKALSKR